jgi:dTDP-4-amino-4,6-dideoxygalactose transaminase
MTSKLAIFGGKPVVDAAVHGRYPIIGLRERELINKVLDSGELWGPWAEYTQQFEQLWADRVGVKYCALLNSGTAALHSGLAGCGIGPNDEVIVPANTFFASAAAVLMVGAIPIFVDVQPETGNIDPSQIEKAISEQTRAIMVVHLHGLPADVDSLLEIAKAYKLFLIEDCAQAHGATYCNRQVGSIGDVAAFSLNATKVLAGAEGGMLTTDSEEIFNRAARLRVFGTEWRDNELIYRDADSFGYNFRSNEFTAALALARAESLDTEQEWRISNAKRFIAGISDLAGVQVPTVPNDRTHIFQMIRLRLDGSALGIAMPADLFRERVLAALNAEGADWWTWETKPLPNFTVFKTLNADGRGYPWTLSDTRRTMQYKAEDYPVSLATTRDSIFTTSHYPPNQPSLIDKYIEAFHKVWSSLDEVIELDVTPKS